MKRFLSLFLVLCTLLCLFPVAVSANEGGEGGSEPTATYIDLYVKDGLVALFEAYSATAGEEGVKATSWAPVNLYGKAGYDSYVDPSVFAAGTLVDSASYLAFKWANGYLESYNETAVTNSGMDTGSYLDLSPLLATLGGTATFAVQEVIQYVRPSASNAVFNVEGNTITNWSGSATYEGFSGSFYGCLNFGPCYWQQTKSNINILNQPIETVLAPSYKNIFLATEYYTGMSGMKEFFDADGNSIGNWNAATGPIGVNERTVTRISLTDGVASYNIHWLFATALNGNDFNASYSDQSANTTLKLLNGMPSRIYAVRLYDRVLGDTDYKQNHLADLCGYYQIEAADIASILALSEVQFAELLSAALVLSIDGVYGDTSEGSEYLAGKAALLETLATVITPPEEELPDYLGLYVADGLVALFDAYSASAEDGAMAAWKATNLYGKDGYDSYLDPNSYITTLNNTWSYAEKGALDVNNGYLDLDALGALVGTSYSLQTVVSYPTLGTPNVVDGVLQNRNSLTTCGGYFTSMMGALHFGFLVTNLATGSSGNAHNFLQVIDEQIWWNEAPGAMTQYVNHTYYTSEAYNVTYYDALTDTAGGSYENILVGGPTAIERTIFRAAPTSADGVAFSSVYKIHTQLPFEWRGTADPLTDVVKTIDYGKGNTEAVHSQTYLRVGNGKAVHHSIRVYNKELNAGELAQNHLADLVAYYGVRADGLAESCPVEMLAEVGDRLAGLTLNAAVGTEEYGACAQLIMDTFLELGEELDVALEDAIEFGGVSYRTSGDYGVRALFTVDNEAIALIEKCGFTVVYGAVIYAGEESPELGIDEETGKLALNGKGALVSTDAEGGIKYLTDDKVSFATTVTFAADGSQSSLYETQLGYFAFILVCQDGMPVNVAVDYALVENLDTISLVSVHEYILANEADLTPELIERLEAILPTEE